jgi:imidazolonepropionase
MKKPEISETDRMSNSNDLKLIGPFASILTMRNLPPAGALRDDDLEILEDAALLIQNGTILEIDDFRTLKGRAGIRETDTPPPGSIAFPGLIDAHTHLCWAGSRSEDYALRVGGTSYLEIARRGGGIKSTVRQTRASSQDELVHGVLSRSERLLKNGITTCEVKSGYGLTVDDELKMLRAIRQAAERTRLDLIPTCLAAHIPPGDKGESSADYLGRMAADLLPQIKEEKLARRVDIFIEETAFTEEEARTYLEKARCLGFQITVHADQFSVGGALVAAEYNASSADHLERTDDASLKALVERGVTAIALPGASLGLGEPWTPARKILDYGGSLAIASDWNPGSAPMGHLLLQASVLGAAEKLSMAETWAGMTIRAARALNLDDRGSLEPGRLADMAVWQLEGWRDVLWNQGALPPVAVWKKGERVSGEIK